MILVTVLFFLPNGNKTDFFAEDMSGVSACAWVPAHHTGSPFAGFQA
eukprot:CAMPEP_0194055098 /NCGR_PEP_ID=MMETSP0009_2-20130614/55576_1 /TAXON_ID=210454 /ORGANISM="Grammatophora oceanica, Strain CCMP 410" /LENGTH=46 /DNA_ID= /DNA_START= /DNA_END= /DNA_ORIENTATION=